MIVVDRISAHDSHGKAVLAAPREDTKHTEEKTSRNPKLTCFRGFLGYSVMLKISVCSVFSVGCSGIKVQRP